MLVNISYFNRKLRTLSLLAMKPTRTSYIVVRRTYTYNFINTIMCGGVPSLVNRSRCPIVHSNAGREGSLQIYYLTQFFENITIIYT